MAVVGHVVDAIGGAAVAADAGELADVVQVGGVEVAVVRGHEDIAVDILGGDDRAGNRGVNAQAVIGAGAVVVGQGIAVDLPDAVAAAGSRGGAPGDEAEHHAAVAVGAAAHGKLEGGDVAGIVADDQDRVAGQVDAGEIQRELHGLAGRGLLGHAARIDLGIGGVYGSLGLHAAHIGAVGVTQKHTHVGNLLRTLRAFHHYFSRNLAVFDGGAHAIPRDGADAEIVRRQTDMDVDVLQGQIQDGRLAYLGE